ncbi:hypothetical protein R3I94_017861 [Phoxinus phoxinus]
MEIHPSAVILLLVLCVSFSAHAQQPPPGYWHFLNNHVFAAMTVQKCDSEILAREIALPQTSDGCRDRNAFIVANSNDVKAICGAGGTPRGTNRISNNPLPVITCNLQSGNTQPQCRYRGVRTSRRIVVRCIGAWPVELMAN